MFSFVETSGYCAKEEPFVLTVLLTKISALYCCILDSTPPVRGSHHVTFIIRNKYGIQDYITNKYCGKYFKYAFLMLD